MQILKFSEVQLRSSLKSLEGKGINSHFYVGKRLTPTRVCKQESQEDAAGAMCIPLFQGDNGASKDKHLG